MVQLQNSCSLWVLSCSLPSNFFDKLTFEMGKEKWHLREAKGFERKRMAPEMVPAMVPEIVGQAGAGVKEGEGKIISTAKVQVDPELS